MPTSVSFNLITVSSSYNPAAPSGAQQWAYVLSAGSVTRSQYQDAVYVKDDGGPLPVPAGFDLSDLDASVTFLLQDFGNFVGPGAICLADPSGGGGNLAVLDFSTGNSYIYSAPAGWLVSAATWDGSRLYWAEAASVPLSGPSIQVRVRRSDAMFSGVQTVATYQYFPSPPAVSAVVRPISPRLSGSYLFFVVRWDSSYADLALNLTTLDFSNHSSSVTPDRSFQQRDAIGYTTVDGGTAYAARGTYNASTFPLIQGVWVQADDPTAYPLPIWPDFIANPDWGNGVAVRFANPGIADGVFQEHFASGLVIRGQIGGETEPIPVSTFTPANHPVLAVAPAVFAYAHPYPPPNHLDPIRLSSTEVSTLTIGGISIPDEEWAFIDDGAGNLYGCIYSGADYVSTRNVLVEPAGYGAVGVCINHDSAGKVGDGSLFFQATVGGAFGNFVWDTGANVTYPLASGSSTTPLANPLYQSGQVWWWENPGASTVASTIDNDLWHSAADGSASAKAGTFTVQFPTSYAQTTIDATWFIGDGTHVLFGPSAFGLSRIIPLSVIVTAGSVTGVDDGSGNITGSGIVSGTVNYTTGLLSVHFTTAPANGLPISVQAETVWTAGDSWAIISTYGNNGGASVSSGDTAALYIDVVNGSTGAGLSGLIYLALSGGTVSVVANALLSIAGEWGTGIPSAAGSIRLNNSVSGEAPLWQRLDSGGPTATYIALWPNTGAWVMDTVNTSVSLDLSMASAYDGAILIVNPVTGSFGSSPAHVYTLNPVPSGPLIGLVPSLMFLAG